MGGLTHWAAVAVPPSSLGLQAGPAQVRSGQPAMAPCTCCTRCTRHHSSTLGAVLQVLGTPYNSARSLAGGEGARLAGAPLPGSGVRCKRPLAEPKRAGLGWVLPPLPRYEAALILATGFFSPAGSSKLDMLTPCRAPVPLLAVGGQRRPGTWYMHGKSVGR